jgi:glycosyltransferase involved in cell wall biosynthesis
MTVWIFNAYGPISSEKWRPTRCTMLARTFAARGHSVVWWTAGFSHLDKRHRCHQLTDIEDRPGCTVRLVPTPGYKKHVGLARLWFEAMFAKRAYATARSCGSFAAPDVIIAGHASQAVGYAAVRLSKELGVPLILDVIDLWPEAFAGALPGPLRPLAGILLIPLFALRRWIFSNAGGIAAVCQGYLDVHTRLQPAAKSAVVYWAVDLERDAAINLHPDSSMTKAMGEVWAIYAGTLGVKYDLDTLLTAAAELKTQAPELQILIAGSGPRSDNLLRRIQQEGLTNVTFLGAKSSDEILALYRICDVGIMGYAPGSTVSFPIKFFDYIAAGLPIVSSVAGELASFLSDRSIGVQYESGNAWSLVKELVFLTKDKECRTKMAQNAFRTASMFERTAQYGRFVDLACALCSPSAAAVAVRG